MQLLLDPSTSRHRRCLSLNDANPNHERELYIEPLFLKDDTFIKSPQGRSVGALRSRTIGNDGRRKPRIKGFESAPKSNRRRRNLETRGIDEDGDDSCGSQKSIRSSSFRRSTLVERLSSSWSTELLEDSEMSLHLCNNDTFNQKARQIQGALRGYIGRLKAKEARLRQKLLNIEVKKQEQLERMQACKQRRLRQLHRDYSQKFSAEAKTGAVTQLILKAKRLRDKNAQLGKQLQKLRERNKLIAISHSKSLTKCKQAELGLNRADWCSIRLVEITKLYQTINRTGRKMLQELDDRSLAELKRMAREESDRHREIERMITIAEAEDLLLVQKAQNES